MKTRSHKFSGLAGSREIGKDSRSSDRDRRTARAEQFLPPDGALGSNEGRLLIFLNRRKRRRFVRKHLVSRSSALTRIRGTVRVFPSSSFYSRRYVPLENDQVK